MRHAFTAVGERVATTPACRDSMGWGLDLLGERITSLRNVWLALAVLASPLFTDCGTRTGLLTPPPTYKVLFPSATVVGDRNTMTLSLWHSRTGAVTTVGTYATQVAAMSFDGRFIALQRCVSAQSSCFGNGAVLDVIAQDGTIVWSQPETTGQVQWGWLGALRPDGQRVVVSRYSIPYGLDAPLNACVLDRQGTPVPIRQEAPADWLTEAAYSPDGHTLVFIHQTTTSTGKPVEPIGMMRDDGTGETILVGHTPLEAADAFVAPSFSFDGTAVVYQHFHDQVCDVDTVDVASRETRTVYSGSPFGGCGMYSPHFTPDGSAIVIRDLDDSLVETLRRIDLATGNASILWQGQLPSRPWPLTVSVAVDEP
jgi:hypothetical protein